MFNISSKFEINLTAANVVDASDSAVFIVKNKVPAIVVPPNFFMSALMERQKLNAQYRIIVAVDFENLGKNYALDKIRDLQREILEADGWDILLTPGKTEIETNNEMINLTKFLKQANQLAEIRWVIGNKIWTEDNINTVLGKVSKNPSSYIRTDPNVTTDLTLEDHDKVIKLIREKCATRIKISGNVNWDVIEKYMTENVRFDVTMKQAKDIVSAALKFYEAQQSGVKVVETVSKSESVEVTEEVTDGNTVG